MHQCVDAPSSVHPAESPESIQAQLVIQRFHLARRYVQRMKDVGKNELFTLTMCPEKYSIGTRTTPGQVRFGSLLEVQVMTEPALHPSGHGSAH